MISKLLSTAVAAMLFLACSCGKHPVASGPSRPLVEIATVQARDVPEVKEWIGTLDGRVNAEIRAQITGYVLRQNYREGAFVRKGQLLFEIDARPFQAALDQANANLAQARGTLLQAGGNLRQNQARLGKAELDVKRYTPLAKTRALSQEEMDNATQSLLEAQAAVQTSEAAIQAAKAAVAAAEAAVDTAQVQLGFTRIASPIEGVAGLATVQVGDLVSPNSPALTVVSTVDPIKAYFAVSEQEYIAAHRVSRSDDSGIWSHGFELILADGSTFPYKGSFFMEDRQVDVGTGALRMAALFPNPGNLLRPGQYCRVRAVIGIDHDAAVVPQRAVAELQGGWQLAVVDSENRVTMRNVQMGERMDGEWVVKEGAHPGERVVVEGLLKVRTGVIVSPRANPKVTGAD